MNKQMSIYEYHGENMPKGLQILLSLPLRLALAPLAISSAVPRCSFVDISSDRITLCRLSRE